MTKTVVAIFNTREEGKDATDRLLINGFKREDIDVSSGNAYTKNRGDGENAVSRFFTRLFGNKDETNERYTKVAEHRYIVTVHAGSDERARKASELLDAAGAVDVNEDYEKRFGEHRHKTNDEYVDKEDNDADVNEDAARRKEDRRIVDERGGETRVKDDVANDDANNNRTIPVIEEDMKVDKKKVATGGVRIRSRIVEKPIEEHIRLRDEHIHVERNKVDRPATEEELENFRNGKSG